MYHGLLLTPSKPCMHTFFLVDRPPIIHNVGLMDGLMDGLSDGWMDGLSVPPHNS